MENLKIGGVYKSGWSDNLMRIIGLDDIEVFYDSLRPHINSWTFSGHFKKKCFFYRTSSKFFQENSEFVEYLPLTELEQNAFRPDLAMRIARTKELNWNDFGCTSYLQLKEESEKLFSEDFLSEKIFTDKIVLLPQGNKGGLKKGTIITAANSRFFESMELIWKAKEFQEAASSQISNGIGIYRIGFEKELPSYYIGEYIDSAGLFAK